MVWILEKKIFYHLFDLGFEAVEIPIRVKFEFEVREGALVADSLSKNVLYNQLALERRYPSLDRARLQHSIEKTVQGEIDRYLRRCGYLREESM
jgi:hypothetical protein